MTKYAQHVNKRQTPQSEPALPEQVQNSAGGYTFVVDAWSRLDRFLILGNAGGTYYASEKKLTKENAANVEQCLHLDGPRTVARIVEISDAGRAPKNDSAIFALAVCAGAQDRTTRAAALAALPKVCRTSTHLFSFVDQVRNFRGWGRSLRTAICKWYVDRPVEQLAHQVVKYQQRDGWSHRDVLRLAGGALKDMKLTEAQKAVFRWIVAGPDYSARTVARSQQETKTYESISRSAVPELIDAYEQVKAASSAFEVVKLIDQYGLTHEMVPTAFKNDVDVWYALLQDMPITALIRNLGKLSAVGVLKPLSEAVALTNRKLLNVDVLRKGRVHPLALLVALNTYRSGHGVRGKLTWQPVPQVIDALDEAFYLAFGVIEPTGKSRLIALDISGSMDSGQIAGMIGVTPRVGSAAMAMTTVHTEANYHVVGFTNGSRPSMWSGYGSGITTIDLSKRKRLDDVVDKLQRLPMGGTDCALPMLWAAENKIEVDAVEILTDNETWAGKIHPYQALEQYRQKMGRDCKCIVVGMTATEFSIANPSDRGMMDIVGFDTAAPSVMANFIKGVF